MTPALLKCGGYGGKELCASCVKEAGAALEAVEEEAWTRLKGTTTVNPD